MSPRGGWRALPRIAASALLVLVAVLVLSAGGVQARPAAATVPQYAYKPEMLEGLRLVDDGKYVKARDAAEKFFAADPESFQSWFLMGVVLENAEGNLPRAWYFLSGARQRMEKMYGGDDIPQDGPWWLHRQILINMAEVAGQMEKYEEELALLDILEHQYKPTYAAWYAWPLMKLGRYDEAKAKIAQALADRPNDPNSVAMAYNSLGAVEGEQENIEEAYRVFLKLIDLSKARGWGLEATYYHNAAEQAMELHRFTEQEQLLIEATKLFDPRSYTNPYIGLSQLYLSTGRVGEALSSIRHMHEWSHDSEPRIEQQHWNEQQETTAAGLLAAGFDTEALALMRRTLSRPDRRGANSMKQDQTEIASLVLYRELLAMERERYSEHASWCTWREWFALQAARVENQREMWTVASRAAATIIANNRLVWALRPYAIDSRIFEWMRPSLGQILGDGVISVELEKLLARTDEAGAREKPYLLANLGEAAAARGYPASAIENLRAALDTVPQAEVMLRTRATAVLASCQQQLGEFDEAVAGYRRTMEKSPNMMRELGLALPVKIEQDGTDPAAIAAGWLRHSPRFNDLGDGFTLRVSGGGNGLEASLLCADGTVLCTTSVPLDGDAKQTARMLCADLHNKAFMPKIDLSQTDINSLDGSNQTGDTNRDKLMKTFGQPGTPEGSPSPNP